MAQFYGLLISTDIGGASLIRNWGRIGTNGPAMMETFDEEAGQAKRFLGQSAASASAAITP